MDPSLASALQAWKLETEFRDGERHHKVLSGVERWVEEKHLGNGTFGCVYQERCVSGPSASAVRAVKQILKYQSKLSHRELQALTTFSDARVPEYQNHFVRCLGWFEDKDKLYIAMEFIQHGDLHGYIRRGILPEPEAAAITAQVAQALRFMHQKGFVHRDLKPLVGFLSCNILVSRPAPDWHVKVADFGATKNMDGTKLGTHGIGTNGYVAPEQLDDSLADSYSPSVDIFALGAIVFCMCTGSPPFRSPGPLFAYVRDSSLFPIGDLDELTGLCSKFVLRAMAARASERATIDELLTHRWLLKHSGGNKG
ncbi:kinase-like protein [Diplogelasinospora grovesii]|uniref:Autophagy-related protein 1 n=1 Tax=Diplogelasinospora grovesii TaxID=303347 RepID=A0AAN6S4B1_9PEZI|nr:kinase-like protein [Diplogelasinospora grovesii]